MKNELNAIKAMTVMLNSVIWYEGAYIHAHMQTPAGDYISAATGPGAKYTNEQRNERLRADGHNAHAAFEAFDAFLLVSGWQRMGSPYAVEYIHDTDGRIECANVHRDENGRYKPLQHAYASYFEGYRNPITPDTDTTYEENAD